MHWCDRCLFQSPVYYGLCLSEHAFKKELKRLSVKPKHWPNYLGKGSLARTHFFEETNDNHTCAIICIQSNKKYKLSEYIGLLTHECIHVWQEIRKNINEKKPSSEFEAYCIQFLTQEIIQTFLKSDFGKACIKRELKKK